MRAREKESVCRSLFREFVEVGERVHFPQQESARSEQFELLHLRLLRSAWESESERDSEKERGREREREGEKSRKSESEILCALCACVCVSVYSCGSALCACAYESKCFVEKIVCGGGG